MGKRHDFSGINADADLMLSKYRDKMIGIIFLSVI
jgi:hypothetical protein